MNKLMLWCSSDRPPPLGHTIVYWSQYVSEESRNQGHVSLPQIIGENVEYWKSRYLAWLDEISKSPCADTNVVEALLIRPGLSYWWMSIPTEYSFSPKSIAYTTLRLWAFVQIVNQRNVKEIYVAGANATLKETIEAWCAVSGIEVSFIPVESVKERQRLIVRLRSRIRKNAPLIAVGLAYLVRQYLVYFNLRRFRNTRLKTLQPSIAIFDDLVHCDIAAAHRAEYKPHYWGSLTKILEDQALPTNWVHVDVRNSALPKAKMARKLVADLNRGPDSSHHFLLQDAFTLKVLAKSFKTYLRIRRMSRMVNHSIFWIDPISNVDIADLVAGDLQSDFRGINAARNAVWICLFETFMDSLPIQQKGIYLMENQPFELALLSAWREKSHRPIYGFVHGPVREWDLRYAIGGSPHTSAEECFLPSPTSMCVNGPLAERNLLSNGIQPGSLVFVEALRFVSISHSNRPNQNSKSFSSSDKRILILGEYGSDMSSKQVTLLSELIDLMPISTIFTFRPHPGASLSREDLPLRVQVSQGRNIEFDLNECDVVIASNVSNASLDAFLNGLPLVIQGDGQVLNGTPIPRGSQVRFSSAATDIVKIIASVSEDNTFTSISPDSVFFLDVDYPKWRALLSI